MRVRLVSLLCAVVLLTGCKGGNAPLDKAMALRSKMLTANGCRFHATITADYGEHIYIFSMDCTTDQQGNLTFSVTEPATIAGITGTVSSNGGTVTFDDKVLAFQTMADGQITPVSAPWVFVNTLRSGYIKGCADADDRMEISIDDSYEEEALHLQIITKNDLPVSAEIFWKGRRVLTLNIENFACL